MTLPGRRRVYGSIVFGQNALMPMVQGLEGRALRGRAVYTALHGARLSSVPSGDQSANPASVPGRSGLQRALLSVSSAQKYSGAGRLAIPSGISRAARLAVPCRFSLLTLPVFQGAAVSSEHFSQSLPPRNVAELGGSPPLRGSLEQLDRPSPAGPPLQGTELAALSTTETSLERLVPLVDYSAAWKLLPNVSRWVTHTVEQGYVALCRSLSTGSLPCWWVPSRLW